MGKRMSLNSSQKEKVFKRDEYACRICGRNDEIETHHIKPWSYFEDKEKADNIDNCITLCHICHRFAPNDPVLFAKYMARQCDPYISIASALDFKSIETLEKSMSAIDLKTILYK